MLCIRKVAAEAIAAVYGAGAGGNQQHTARVLAQQARIDHRRGLPQRIRPIARHALRFLDGGQHLPQQRIIGVAATHAGDVGPRHPQRKASLLGGIDLLR